MDFNQIFRDRTKFFNINYKIAFPPYLIQMLFQSLENRL